LRERPTWATALSENEALLARVRDRILDDAALRSGQTALDLGAGTGLLALGALPRVSPGGRVVALDRDSGCLDVVARRAAALGVLGDEVVVVAGSADALPLASASVDAVVVRSVLVYVADPATAAAEIGRVLKPGGRFSLYEPLPGALREVGSPIWRQVWAVRLALERLLAEQRQAPRNRATVELTADSLAANLRSAGLADVGIEPTESVKLPPTDPAKHFDLLRLPGGPSPDDAPWYARLRQSFAEADLRAYVEHACSEARLGRYRVVLPGFYLRGRKVDREDGPGGTR